MVWWLSTHPELTYCEVEWYADVIQLILLDRAKIKYTSGTV